MDAAGRDVLAVANQLLAGQVLVAASNVTGPS
jgi:hypothetical protein